MKKYVKKIPEFVYLIKEGDWFAGPFVHPQKGRQNRKFKLVEITEEEPEEKKKEKKLPKRILCEGCNVNASEEDSSLCFHCRNNN
jgi:hypothetical protein